MASGDATARADSAAAISHEPLHRVPEFKLIGFGIFGFSCQNFLFCGVVPWPEARNEKSRATTNTSMAPHAQAE
jgi:hypothetical protein